MMSVQSEVTQPSEHGVHAPPQPHILIIGAGITGLVLGQALKTRGIPFTIFERDPNVHHRGRGWGLTIHWALPTFLSLLTQHLIDRLPSVYVDPEASARGENGNFLFFDLSSGEARYKVPPSKRIRVSRERLRALLLDGLDIQWSKALTSITHPSSNTIIAHFSDSTSSTGSLLVGADGGNSKARSLVFPSASSHTIANDPLPVRMLGVSVLYPRALAEKLRALDPFFFQGGDPATNTFMYYSFLSTPSSSTRSDDTYECQIIISYPFRSGFLGSEAPIEVPTAYSDRVALLKQITAAWAEPFRECVQSIPKDTEVKSIRIEDWVPRRELWDTRQPLTTLVGDAAHAMTMYRGEAANQGIEDVSVLLSHILPLLSPEEDQEVSDATADGSVEDTTTSLEAALKSYEYEMIERTTSAVLTSRRACLDAHEYSRIGEDSPLVNKRVKVS